MEKYSQPCLGLIRVRVIQLLGYGSDEPVLLGKASDLQPGFGYQMLWSCLHWIAELTSWTVMFRIFFQSIERVSHAQNDERLHMTFNAEGNGGDETSLYQYTFLNMVDSIFVDHPIELVQGWPILWIVVRDTLDWDLAQLMIMVIMIFCMDYPLQSYFYMY